jgi:hypothetical protein
MRFHGPYRYGAFRATELPARVRHRMPSVSCRLPMPADVLA